MFRPTLFSRSCSTRTLLLLDFWLSWFKFVADLTRRDDDIAFLRCIDGDDAGDGLRADDIEAPSDKWVRAEIRTAKEFSSLRDGARHLKNNGEAESSFCDLKVL